MKPKNAKNCSAIDTVPAVKARWRKSRGSSSGCSRVSSQATNPARITTPATIPTSVRALPQPASGASMIEYTRAPRPTTVMSAPTTSSLGASGSADSGTTRSVPATAATASTMLRPKTDRHDHCSSSSPEPSRPRIALPPATPAQTPMARAFCSRGNVLVSVDRVAGMTSAAPSPRTPRIAISAPGLVTVVAAIEPAPKTDRPASRARRRP